MRALEINYVVWKSMSTDCVVCAPPQFDCKINVAYTTSSLGWRRPSKKKRWRDLLSCSLLDKPPRCPKDYWVCIRHALSQMSHASIQSRTPYQHATDEIFSSATVHSISWVRVSHVVLHLCSGDNLNRISCFLRGQCLGEYQAIYRKDNSLKSSALCKVFRDGSLELISSYEHLGHHWHQYLHDGDPK